jgi:hypothetical protein
MGKCELQSVFIFLPNEGTGPFRNRDQTRASGQNIAGFRILLIWVKSRAIFE